MSYQLQNEAMEITSIGGTTKLLLIAIAQYTNNKTGECWPSNNTLAKKISRTRQTVITHLKKLIKAGYVERIFRTGTSNKFKINLSPNNCTGGVKVSLQGGVKVSLHKPVSTNLELNKKQAKKSDVCVNDSITEDQEPDQELALNENEKASPAMAPEETTTLAVIEPTELKAIEAPQETIELQGFLDMYKWGNGESWRIKRAWKRLSKAERVLVQELLPQYVNDTCWKVEGVYGKTYRCHPAKWLNEKRWTEYKLKPVPKPQPKKPIKDRATIEQDLNNKALLKANRDKAKKSLDDDYEQVKQSYLEIHYYQKNWFHLADKETSDTWLIEFIIEEGK